MDNLPGTYAARNPVSYLPPITAHSDFKRGVPPKEIGSASFPRSIMRWTGQAILDELFTGPGWWGEGEMLEGEPATPTCNLRGYALWF